MPIQDRIETPQDPNAPKALDLLKAQRLVAAAAKYERLPTGDVIRQFGEQLKCALDEIAGSSTKIVQAQNEATRYQREAENANRDTQAANTALAKAREELAAARTEIESLKAQLPKPAPEPVATTLAAAAPAAQKARKPRGTKNNVVPIEQAQTKAAT